MAWDAKEFLLGEERCEDVQLESKTYCGKFSKTCEQEQKEKAEKEKKEKEDREKKQEKEKLKKEKKEKKAKAVNGLKEEL